MTLELSLRNPFGLPLALQARKDEPERGYHWINQRHSSDRGASTPNDRDGKPRGGKTRQKVRPLTDLTLGEVEDAYTRFENQLLPTHGNWIAKNYFCQIPLKRRREVPPLVFGRVKTCFPSDGVVDNVEELELYFPQKSGPPDVLHIQKDEISQGSQKWVQSFYLRVRFMVSGEETRELLDAEPLLGANGFFPEFSSGYIDLLEMTTQEQINHPWLYVIGSRWLNSIPDSLHAEVVGKLKEMIGWGRLIFNYHPEWLSNEINSLNRALGYKYGFTDIVLTEPGNAREVGMIVAKLFDRMIFRS